MTCNAELSVEDVVDAVLVRRAAGEEISDDDVLSQHASLRPELDQALTRLALISQAASASDHSRIAALPQIDGYRISKFLAVGGQATVYLGQQLATGQRVALKVISASGLQNNQRMKRFTREREILSTLDHPNIAKIVDHGKTRDGTEFLATVYVDGVDLADYADRLRASEKDWLPKLVEMFVKICDGIAAAHARGIIHRDLKPSNVRINEDGEPIVLDFGLAHLPMFDHEQSGTDLTMLGQMIGSLPHFSPEQATRGTAFTTSASDVYAIGLMLYRAITGRPPYAVTGPVPDVLKNIATVQPASIKPILDRHHSRRLVENMDAVLQTALAKGQPQRYENAEALKHELERCLDGSATSSLLQRKAKRGRRTRMLAVASVLLCAATVTGFVLTRPTAPNMIPLPRLENSVGITMLRVPAGTFIMGSSDDEIGRLSVERRHLVKLTKSFWLATKEVTNTQFNQVMRGSAPHRDDADLPVVNVTLQAATDFCDRLSRAENCHYRLPSEAEWEYACRAGTSTRFSGSGMLPQMGWFRENSDGVLHPAGGKFANHWGFYDMHGNAAEWCGTQFGYYPADAIVDPAPSNDGTAFAVRGGSFNSAESQCRTAYRTSTAQTALLPTIGFRIARD